MGCEPEMQSEPHFSQQTGLLRRSANYKPNIWKYNLLESLTSEFADEKYETQAKKLKEEVTRIFTDTGSHLDKLELIDKIGKLGLAYLFGEEIKRSLYAILSSRSHKEDLYATALCFRLLRQHGFDVSQDMFEGFVDNSRKFKRNAMTNADVKAILELFEVSNLAYEGEYMLEEAKVLATGILRNISAGDKQAKQVARALELPLQYRVDWYDVKGYIQDYEEEEGTENRTILNLAKINFNIIQATYQEDLKDIVRWWRNLGVAESLSFSRNRIVESFMWSVGVAFEPQCGNRRKWLSKVIKLIIILDDVYDVYGSLEELEIFTGAVNRWEYDGIENLPECMKICFQTLYETANEIAEEIQGEKNWFSLVLPHLQEAWSGFCNALLVEAKWYNTGYTPSFEEYLENGRISSSGPLISLHAFLSITSGLKEEDVLGFWKTNHHLVYETSLIIRLCNDQATSSAEVERGDAPSSILCLMREANISEEMAREKIGSMIASTWKKINNQYRDPPSPQFEKFTRCITNTARVAHFIYKNGDGFGVQDRDTRDLVLAILIEPFKIAI